MAINTLRAPAIPEGQSTVATSGNPVLDEIDSLHQNAWESASPQTKQALAQSGAPMPIPSGTPAATAAPSAPMAPPIGGSRPIAPPIRSQAAEHNLSALRQYQQSPAGIDKLPLPGKIPLKILEGVGSMFAPGLVANIPGTELHHRLQERQLAGRVTADEKMLDDEARRQQESATAAHTTAEIPLVEAQAEEARNRGPLTAAQAREAEARAHQMEHPEIQTPLQAAQTRHANAQAATLENPPEKAANIHVLPSGEVVAIHTDPATGESTAKVVYKGDPALKTEVKQLEIGGKPHQVLINSQTGATIKDLGETGEKPPTVNVNAATSALDRELTHFGKPYQTMHDAATGQLDRITEAQRMISSDSPEALALAVPKMLTALVSGQGTGVRITQPELNAITNARVGAQYATWLQRMFTGKSLSADQRKQAIQILDDIGERVRQKQAIAGGALDEINGAGSRDAIVAADKKARKALDEFERGGNAGGTVDPNVKAYADKYFGGDVKKAQAAIEQQRGKK